MMDFVRSPKPRALEEDAWHHRVNSILNAIRVQQRVPTEFADILIDLASRKGDPVLSLYAIQHLSMWLPEEQDSGKQAAIKDLFERLMRTPGDPMAGTAVLLSSDLERQHVEGFEPEVIEKAALRLVADRKATQDVRISALHACCDRNLSTVLKDARVIAADISEISVLRKAAIHAIGRMGDESDLPLLLEVAKESRHIAAAANPASQRISLQAAKR
jgi:hypothetical protein